MISIIGAGPAGSYLGYLLSKNNIPCRIIEQKREIGIPEQCTGLISRNLEELIPISWVKKSIQNSVNGAVISCGKSSFEISAGQPKAYVFDRTLFDQAVAERADKAGCRIMLGKKYISHKAGDNINVKLSSGNSEKIMQASSLVGADGPHSSVARQSGLYGKRIFWTGTQVILRTKKPFFEKDRVYVFLDRRYSDGFFAWTVPLDEDHAKVGLASYTNPAGYLRRLLKEKFHDHEVKDRSAGIIPVYRKIPVQNKAKNTFLIGDAAMQVKATSGGGVVNGMLAAKELLKAIKSGDMDYEKRIGFIRRNLWLHLRLRKKLNSMDDNMKESLLRTLNDSDVKKVLRKKGDMDFPKRFIFDVLLAKPGLLRFIL
ncbi:geranylgeranyl reductase family protein [Candidatus Woesearchaeota archaeon]|nr:geranylgeranyl reductase family protein [Candidatus Woesearchaeota archaeon]